MRPAAKDQPQKSWSLRFGSPQIIRSASFFWKSLIRINIVNNPRTITNVFFEIPRRPMGSHLSDADNLEGCCCEGEFVASASAVGCCGCSNFAAATGCCCSFLRCHGSRSDFSCSNRTSSRVICVVKSAILRKKKIGKSTRITLPEQRKYAISIRRANPNN